MELKVTQENLNQALSIVARVASGRSTLPILSNVLLQITDKRLKISATNLDIAISKFVGAKVVKEGSLTVPARLLQDFIANLPTTTIHLKQEDNKLHIKTENHSSTINGITAEEFPVMPTIKDGENWALPAKDVKKALQQVIIAASNDESRPILTGVYLKTEDNNLYMAATDSYRLAEKLVGKMDKKISVILPATAAQDLLRIISDTATSSKISVTNDGQQVRFEVNDTELIARLIDGQYPDYKKLIPVDFETEAIVNKTELINITKVSNLFARESAGSIVIKTKKNDGKIEIQSVASQIGENTASADAKVSNDSEITLNARFLLDGLQAIDGEDISICFNGKLQPVLIKEANSTGYTHIVMPLKS